MKPVRLTLELPEFLAVCAKTKTLILRQDHYDDACGFRVAVRRRPTVGENVNIVCNERHHASFVKDVRTVAIFFNDDHPLWIDGEPVSHIEQEGFAKAAEFPSWKDLGAFYGQYAYPEFNGYVVELTV